MAAFLELDVLRALEAPLDAHVSPDADRRLRRPRLSATWIVAANGALVCRWDAATPGIDPLPD